MKKLIVAASLLATSVAAASAQEAYSPGDRETLVQTAIPGVEGQQITIERITFGPGWQGDRHTHGGPVYVYVLDGSFEVDVDGQEPARLAAGEVLEEPVGEPMVARNPSDSDPVTIMLVQISAEGEPLMRRAD